MEVGTQAEWFAGVASSLAVVVALGGNVLSTRQRRSDKRDRERQAAKQIAIKLLKAFNSAADISRHLNTKYVGTPLEGVGVNQLWRTVQPLIGIADDPGLQLDGAEQVMLIDAEAHGFLMGLTLAITRYRSLVVSMKEYTVRYDFLQHMMPAPVGWDAGISTHKFTREEVMKLLPYSSVLDSIVLSMTASANENLDNLQKLTAEYNPIMQKYFGDDKFPKFKIFPGTDLVKVSKSILSSS